MPKTDQPLNATMGDIFLKELAPKESRFPPEKLRLYQQDPVAYAEEVLRIKTLTPAQQIGLRALVVPPYRVAMKSATGVGKTHAAAVAINWKYDCFNPSVTITTAPTDAHVKSVLWKQVRLQRQTAGLSLDFRGDVAAKMFTSPDHSAEGFTTRLAGAFKGRHDAQMLFVIDEGDDVVSMVYEMIQTMFMPQAGHHWLVLFNPRLKSSHIYQEENAGEEADGIWRPKWKVVTISALEHPNVVSGEQKIVGAVSRSQIDTNVLDWCEQLRPDDEHRVSDFQWPPGSESWWRAGPEFQTNCLGQWPDDSDRNVWSDSVWEAIAAPVLQASFPDDMLPEIGGDLSSGGSNMTAIHGRWGAYSLLHDEHQGWSGPRKLGRIIEMCHELGEYVDKVRMQQIKDWSPLNPRLIRIKLDDAAGGWDMIGHLREQGYNAVGINASQIEGVDIMRYPKMRSQLWFQTVRKAEAGLVKLGLLPRRVIESLKLQAMAPEWKQDGAGRRVVEEKDITMEKLGGRSPDSMDALNLAFLTSNWQAPQAITVPRAPLYPRTQERGRDERAENSPVRNVRRSRDLFGRRFQ